MQRRYTLFAYLLWLLLGWLGVHHFYLRRHKQGVLWLTSFSGFFGIGWLRDFWRLPTYVRDSNDDPEFLEQLNVRFRHLRGPRVFSNWHRLVGQVLFGAFYRGLIHCAIPWESSVIDFAALIVPLGTAFGTYMVSNVGRQKSPFYLALIGAYVGEFLMGEPHLVLEGSNAVLVAGVAMVFSTYGWEWRRDREDMSCGKCLLVVVLVYGIFIGLCCSFVYFNASVETEDGETIKVRDALENFFNSPAWQQIKTAFWVLLSDIYQSWRTGGYEKAWSKFVDLADIEGEDHAYDVLELERGAEFKEVRKRYKELAREWHP
ncbi:DnaJ homolog subfamily C member 22 [Geodia barretti]|uniref:DnaJ homolog subfamily C member 22 n=1 Tax=Geodia barretti TaxID=519541 RepID=A0AA35W1C3_GEOBA|nr:DnaJ homolog subfamily C member 22 [Geodia barretti]